MSKIPLNTDLISAAVAGRGGHRYMRVETLKVRGEVELHCSFTGPNDPLQVPDLERFSEEQRKKIEEKIAENTKTLRVEAGKFAEEIRSWLAPFDIDFARTVIFYGIHPGHEDKGEFLRVFIAPAKVVRDPRSEFEDRRSQYEGR